MRRTLIMTLMVTCSMVLLVPVASAKKKKEKKEEGPAPAAWFDYHGTQCYQPPDFAAETNEPKKRMMRQKAMEEILRLMRGEINEQIVVEERKIDEWETDFLGKPTAIEPFLVNNLEQCKKFADGEVGLKAYSDWLASAGKRATAGDCHNPLTYELHQNISVQDGWQVRRHMCTGDSVWIETTSSNKYTVADTGDYETTPWITPAGDPAQPEAGEGAPCPHCPVGAVVYKFEFEDKSQPDLIDTLGTEKEIIAPSNGYISFTVNDVTYYDNRFNEQNGVIDYLPMSIYPPVLGVDVDAEENKGEVEAGGE